MSSPEKFWLSLLAAISREDLTKKYPDRASRIENYDQLAIDLAEAFFTRPRDHWLPLLEKHDVPFAPEHRIEDLSADPQVQHLGVFYEMEHPQYGKVSAPHRPIRYDGDNHSNFMPPPDLGEHTREVLGQAGLKAEDLDKLAREGVI